MMSRAGESRFLNKPTIFQNLDRRSRADWMLAMKDRRQAPFGDVRSTDLAEGVFSPNRRWIAYQARETGGARQVFVQPFPSTGAE